MAQWKCSQKQTLSAGSSHVTNQGEKKKEKKKTGQALSYLRKSYDLGVCLNILHDRIKQIDYRYKSPNRQHNHH